LDEDIGLMDYKARFYSPVLNRFIQPDSIVPDPTNPQAWNRFSYVYNRPTVFNDPTGHDPWWCPNSGCIADWVEEQQNNVSSWIKNTKQSKGENVGDEEVGVFTKEELKQLDIDCGNNVAELTCQLYTNPSAFNFEMQVEYANWVYLIINPNIGTYMACQIVWQGCIYDGSTYIMLPTTVSHPNGGVDWNRNAALNGTSEPLFYANWQVGIYNGAPAAIERFPMRGGDLGYITAYLSPSARNNGIVWSSSNINYVGFVGDHDISISPFKIIFATQQTGSSSILTVGNLSIIIM